MTGDQMKIAYLDCFSGISGDMFLGALVDAGLPLDRLRERLKGLALHGYRIEASREARHGISGTRFSVVVEGHQHTHRNLKAIQQAR